MDKHSFVAFDLGAESGRTILGTLEKNQLAIQQITRFPNEMKSISSHLHWDIDALFGNIKEGLRACSRLNVHPESIGIDAWGVDYGLLGPDGSFIDLPHSYRDHRTEGMMEKFFELVPRRRVYELTGIQFMQLNTLFQLYAAVQQNPGSFERASRLLFMPDIFNYLLTGETKTEFTVATTSQLLNPRSKSWEPELFAALKVPQSLMQEIVDPAMRLGMLRRSIAQDVSLAEISVTAVASHDTGSAIAAIPAEGEDWAYISSGTWSLMGVELREPIVSDEALSSNFTNEGGVAGTFRFLKNIMGLWLLQQCRKEWSTTVQYNYDEMTRLAEGAKPFRSLIDPDYSEFFNPMSMTGAICQFCQKTGQPIPESHAEYIRSILESLALKYRSTLDQLRRLTGQRVTRIHIIGGGAKNTLLCQFAANATGATVIAGPVEATAIGNLLVQALASGCVGSLKEMRAVVRQSFQPVSFEPKETDVWQSAYERYKTLSTTGH
ncbi:MAG: rhamnulokinase family protein [Ignavibacteria bacterium]|nr:rhamnulokinase family protein [Ignavibacteria bacterium]